MRTRLQKQKKMVITTFSNFFQMPNSIFRRRENPFRERPQTDAYSHFLFSNQISWLRCWVSGVSEGKGEKNLLSPSKKTVISTSGHLANWIANSLFIVESSSLLDPHSEARIVTFTLRDPWYVWEVDAIFKYRSCQISKNIDTRLKCLL